MTREISNTVTHLRLHNRATQSNSKFCIAVVIAQGLPVLVSVPTVVIDVYGLEDWKLPGMGLLRCYLHARKDSNNAFSDAFFLYSQVIILLIISFNMVLFIKMLIYLVKHWIVTRGLKSTRAGSHVFERFRLVARCAFIMGIPMILLVTANLLEFVNGEKNNIIVDLSLISLLAGFYMFVTLVCKKTMLKELKSKLFPKTVPPMPRVISISSAATSQSELAPV